MNLKDTIRNLHTGDVEIGIKPLKRMAADLSGWVCEHCGASVSSKKAPANDAGPTCKSKSRSHKWRRV